MKVLVVDDSSMMRKVMIGALSRIQISDVDQVGDGDEAVTAVSKASYDLVLMDWNMPKMTGIDALKTMRAQGSTVPVIMVTTEAEKSRVMEALKCGASSYVIKPFQPEQLIQRIQQVLEKKAA
ncbi:MAG: response regulator [Candidatus Eisenbacteria bacterium]|nr:response regulator [Candidatus Eisenbacteria bacterium]MCC7140935.1 response regulator [Candidatus Eisenbacteria bacterium]